MKIDTKYIVEAGKVYRFHSHPQHSKPGVRSLQASKRHGVLQAMAVRHAKYQAKIEVQGHHGWDARVKTLYRDIPECGTFSEIVNESWPDQSAKEAAKEMYNSWEKSPGHWGACDSKHAFWGYAMALGKNGIWYSAGIFGDLR